MGENNAEVISIESKPCFKYNCWWVSVVASYMNKNVDTWIQFDSEDDAIAMTVGYKFKI